MGILPGGRKAGVSSTILVFSRRIVEDQGASCACQEVDPAPATKTPRLVGLPCPFYGRSAVKFKLEHTSDFDIVTYRSPLLLQSH